MPSAGEVEQFAYCAHNWWLARQGVDEHASGSSRGMGEHAAIGRAQASAERSRKDARDAFRWMARILAAAGSATFLTLEVIYLRSDPLHWLFLTTALVLVSASAALLVIALDQERRYRKAVVEAGLVPGKVVQQGLKGEEVLRDPDWDLSGAPDYVMDTTHGHVPVEVKTGRTPEHPYESHELQLACYLRLIEVRDGKPPEYGLLTYPDGVFRVAWNVQTQERLRAVLRKMATAAEAGKADRDHQHAGRCAGCARREQCDQRLA